MLSMILMSRCLFACVYFKVNPFPVYFGQTPLDKQELLCGQLAGVSRCVSELSSSPVRILRLRHSKYAIHMENDFLWVSTFTAAFQDVSVLFWSEHETLMVIFGAVFLSCPFQALSCSADVPTISVCELLDQLINLFCFYNGSVRQSYQVQSEVVSVLLQ